MKLQKKKFKKTKKNKYKFRTKQSFLLMKMYNNKNQKCKKSKYRRNKRHKKT